MLAFETRLAALHLRAEERRDPDRTHNRHDRAELAALAPALDLPGYLDALGAGAAESVNVENPALLAGLPEIVTDTEPATLRAYLTFTVVRTVADALPAHIDAEDFAFYGRRIRGQQEQHERVKRVIDAIGADLGEALAQRYVARTFPPEAKERAASMVEAIVEEMRASIQTRGWMGEETRARAEAKLDAMRVKIGYPDRWRDWSGLEIGRASYAANRLNATRFELDRRLAKLPQPVDRDEWELPAHIVNAYYHPTLNEIVVPAGILQPPMFDAGADDAVNFGGIGTVIAHEITHGFDDQGRRFDADGHLRDWWTPEDAARFTELADRLVDQFEAYVVLDDVHVNGRLTLGENIADLGGLTLAGRAHRAGRRRRAGHRRAHAGTAVLPGQRDALAGQHQPGAAADAGRDRPAQPAPAAGARPGLQPRGVPGRVRAPRRGADHAPARAEDRDLVMKAIVQDDYGPPDVLSLREIDPPVAGDDELLIRVHAAGLDQGVWHVMAGMPYMVRLMGFGVRAPKTPVRGTEVAGVVEAVGRNVTRFAPGDEVFGVGDGTFAEFTLCARGEARSQAGQRHVRAGGRRAGLGRDGAAGPTRHGPAARRPARAGDRRRWRRRELRRSAGQGLPGAGDRRLQRGEGRLRPVARRRCGHRLHARGLRRRPAAL